MANLDIRNKAFDRQLKKFLKVSTKAGTQEIRDVALNALKGVMRKSPVDKGTFKGNWNVGINEINVSVDADYTSKSEKGRFNAEKFQEGKTVLGSFKTGQSINISNALPYANRLEFTNHSTQGTGMVRRTLSEITIAIKKKLKKV